MPWGSAKGVPDMEGEEDPGTARREETKTGAEGAPESTKKGSPGGGPGRRVRTEEFQVSGRDLMDLIRRLLAESGVRRIILRRKSGRVLLEIPMTAGLAVGGAAVLFAPVLTALGVIAALWADISVVVVREDRDA